MRSRPVRQYQPFSSMLAGAAQMPRGGLSRSLRCGLGSGCAAYSPRSGRLSIRVSLGTLNELEYGNTGFAPSLKFLTADKAIKAALIPEDTFFLRTLINGPALAGDRLHRLNKSQF